ncbi:phosphotransferase family protein [Actinoplanes sp. CA-015351]|uniref:phosphotransferase family protein n=1 Tax=Actinoplanes sp. CA-015351 TaxID=3239897 RepID=UPI003D95EDA9
MRSTGTNQARAIAASILGHDPGPMTTADSLSHQVHVAGGIVVKVIEAGGHSRLDREITLGSSLPPGLTAELLASGVHEAVRYAAYTRVPGTAPGMGLPDTDTATACSLARQAVKRLHTLHDWAPPAHAEKVLREPLDHGGFAGRPALLAEIESIAAVLPAVLLDGLMAIAETAPSHAGALVPVHADCHWGNWLALDGTLTALLDFEWARFGEPMDDWFFLIADSGVHTPAVLDVIAAETGMSPDVLRAACEVREANYLAADIRLALSEPGTHAGLLDQRLNRLRTVIVDRVWRS